MRVALVNPPNSVAKGEVGANAAPPLGIASIAAYLRKAGEDVDLFDLSGEVPLDLNRLANSQFFDYGVYGLTSYTKTFPSLLSLVRQLKRVNPAAIVVVGGPHVSPIPVEILKNHASIDFVISNEGEVAMRQLLLSLRGEGSLGDVQNLCFRQQDQIIQSRVSPDYPPPDQLPFPARDFRIEPDREVYESRGHSPPARIQYMCSSRGCPKRCSFCSIIVMSPKFRARSVDSLMREVVELHAELPFAHIQFLDANFFVIPTRALMFARALHAWNPKVTWSASATADWICRYADVVREIGGLNCLSLEVGIENGSAANLARYKKGATVDHNEATVHILEDAGIELDLDFVLFDPETTLQDLQENLKFLGRLSLLDYFPAEHFFNALKLYPGTEAREAYMHRMPLAEKFMDHELVPPFDDARVGVIYEHMTEFESQVMPRLKEQVRTIDRIGRAALEAPTTNERGTLLQDAFVHGIRLRFAPARIVGALTANEHWTSLAGLPQSLRAASAYEIGRAQSESLLATGEQLLAALNHGRGLKLNNGERSTERFWRNADVRCLGGLVEEDAEESLYLVPLWRLPVRLNQSGACAWRAIKQSACLRDTISTYADRQGCTIAEASAEIEAFVAQLRTQGVLSND